MTQLKKINYLIIQMKSFEKISQVTPKQKAAGMRKVPRKSMQQLMKEVMTKPKKINHLVTAQNHFLK